MTCIRGGYTRHHDRTSYRRRRSPYVRVSCDPALAQRRCSVDQLGAALFKDMRGSRCVKGWGGLPVFPCWCTMTRMLRVTIEPPCRMTVRVEYFVWLFLGIGGAVVIDSTLQQERNVGLGEIGRITVETIPEEDGSICRCGRTGMWRCAPPLPDHDYALHRRLPRPAVRSPRGDIGDRVRAESSVVLSPPWRIRRHPESAIEGAEQAFPGGLARMTCVTVVDAGRCVSVIIRPSGRRSRARTGPLRMTDPIARALGVRPSVVAPLVRRIAAEGGVPRIGQGAAGNFHFSVAAGQM
jgi:hypothetical protein